jgi:hypothetical protein
MTVQLQLQRRREDALGCRNATRAGRITPTTRRCRPAGGKSCQSRVAKWPNRDPIGEKGGENLYCMVWNDTISLWDYLGFACTVQFDCTLNPAWTRPKGLSALVISCPYTCKEADRQPSFGGIVDCTDIPRNLTLNIDVTKFCSSCPKTTTDYRIFSSSDLKTDCSRQTCHAGCDLTFDSMMKSKDPKVKAAALLAKVICYDGCNAICRKP